MLVSMFHIDEKVTYKHFKHFFNIIWMDDRDEKLLFKKL